MKTLQKVAFQQIKSSRGRFCMTVLGVMLSTAMILAVLLGSTASLSALQRFVISTNGLWHWTITEMQSSVAATLVNDTTSKSWGILGGQFTASTDLGAPVLFLGTSGDLLELMQTELVSGEKPKTPNEVLIEQHLADRYRLDIGSSFTLTREDGTQRTVTVSGIFSQSVLMLQFRPPDGGFRAFYGIDWNAPTGEDRYRFFSQAQALNQKYYTYTEQLGQSVLASAPQAVPFYHNSLLTLYESARPNGDFKTLFFINLLRGGMILIVAVASGMMIINSFYISLAERRRTLGMLVSAGATGGQAASCLLYEALCVGALGIPLGLAAGYGGLAVTFWVLSPGMEAVKQAIGADISLRLTFEPLYLVASALISLAVLLISAWLPAHGFAKKSIMQIIAGTEEISISQSVKRAGWLAERWGGTTAVLAVKNAKRNRRRYTATVSSLVICIMLFIASAGIVQYLPVFTRSINTIENYPIQISYASNEQNLTQTPLYNSLLHPKTAVDKVVVSEQIFLDNMIIPANTYTEETQELALELSTPQQNGGFQTNIHLTTVSDEEFAQAGGKGTVEGDTLPCILLNRYFFSTQDITQTVLKAGDTLQAALKGLPVTLSITGVDQSRYVEQRLSPSTLVLLTSQSAAESLFERWHQANGSAYPRNINIRYSTEASADLLRELKALSYGDPITSPENNLLVSDKRSEFALSQISNQLLSIILFGFSCLVGLIGACHVITTISTGLRLQQTEFAMLCSMGATEKDLCKIVLVQSAIHGIEALLWGIPLGLVLLLLEYTVLRQITAFLFSMPWWSLLVSAAGVFLVAIIAAAPHLRRLRKHSIIENLRALV